MKPIKIDQDWQQGGGNDFELFGVLITDQNIDIDDYRVTSVTEKGFQYQCFECIAAVR